MTSSGLLSIPGFSRRSSYVTIFDINFSKVTPSGSFSPPHRDNEYVPRCFICVNKSLFDSCQQLYSNVKIDHLQCKLL